MVSVARETRIAALLAVDDGDDGGDFEAGLLGPGDRLEGGAAGRDDVLEDDDAAAFQDVVLDDAPGAVVLGRLADEEAAQGARRQVARRLGAGAGGPAGARRGVAGAAALPGEADDLPDSRDDVAPHRPARTDE